MSDLVSTGDSLVLRICDVTDEGLVLLEPPGFPYQTRDKAIRTRAYAKLRRRLGANGTLLSVAPMSRRSASDGHEARQPRRRP